MLCENCGYVLNKKDDVCQGCGVPATEKPVVKHVEKPVVKHTHEPEKKKVKK